MCWLAAAERMNEVDAVSTTTVADERLRVLARPFPARAGFRARADSVDSAEHGVPRVGEKTEMAGGEHGADKCTHTL